MKRNKLKVSKTSRSNISAIVIGVLIASVISILLTVLVANLVLNGHLEENSTAAVIFIIRAISLLIGALIGASLLKQNYLKLVGFITAGYLILLTGTGIVFYSGNLKSFISGAASVLIGGVATLLILQTPRGNRIKRKKFPL